MFHCLCIFTKHERKQRPLLRQNDALQQTAARLKKYNICYSKTETDGKTTTAEGQQQNRPLDAHHIQREFVGGGIQPGGGFQPLVDARPHHGAVGGAGAGSDFLSVEARQLHLKRRQKVAQKRRQKVAQKHALVKIFFTVRSLMFPPITPSQKGGCFEESTHWGGVKGRGLDSTQNAGIIYILQTKTFHLSAATCCWGGVNLLKVRLCDKTYSSYYAHSNAAGRIDRFCQKKVGYCVWRGGSNWRTIKLREKHTSRNARKARETRTAPVPHAAAIPTGQKGTLPTSRTLSLAVNTENIYVCMTEQ